MDKLNVRLEIKANNNQQPGTFSGLASVYGRVDLGGDVVERGAFKRTLASRADIPIPILWQHDATEPIGKGTLTDTNEGLAIEGQLVLESPVAVKAYALLKAGVLTGLSIGYQTIKDEVKSNVRYLKELKLWEVSLVTFPMNEGALISAVKRHETPRISYAELAEIKAIFNKFAIKGLR